MPLPWMSLVANPIPTLSHVLDIGDLRTNQWYRRGVENTAGQWYQHSVHRWRDSRWSPLLPLLASMQMCHITQPDTISTLNFQILIVGDLVRTVIVDSTVMVRMPRELVLSESIKPGDVIVGLQSFGQATYVSLEPSYPWSLDLDPKRTCAPMYPYEVYTVPATCTPLHTRAHVRAAKHPQHASHQI